ncbi:condensation domain-containing protein, partial [Streptomyces bobili]|uniref:condensation domain-containing protein n=1 Tax=Streptomyces bobili TaxID=67280 RepID=UPI0036641EC0
PDLHTAWEAAVAGRTPELQPVPTSFRHWTRQLVEHATQQHHELPLWRDILNQPNPQLTHRPLNPVVDTWASARHRSFTVSGRQAACLIADLPAVFRCSVEDVLLTALALAMGTWRHGRDDEHGPGLLVDIERHGREEAVGNLDVSRTVGWFTTVFPVHLDPGESLAECAADAASAESSLKRVKEQLRAVPGNGIGYGLLRYMDLGAAQELSSEREPQVLFNYLGRVSAVGHDKARDAANWTLLPAENVGEGADPEMPMTHALVFNAVTQGTPEVPELLISLSWPGGLLGQDRIVALSEDLRRALAGLANLAGRSNIGGLTPSDVGLLNLSQDEIDEFELDEL